MTPSEISTARQRLGLTQAGLARVLGYRSAMAISNLERGTKNIGSAAARLLRAYLAGYRPPDW